jgi:NAD(P)H-hydrate epimerase
MKVVTAQQMRRIDQVTIQDRGIPGAVLMDRAGRGIAREALERFQPESVAVITGKGNNAGDGFVAARELLAHGVATTLFMLRLPEELEGDALDAFQKLPPETKKVIGPGPGTLREHLIQFDLAIDAIFGTGLVGPVKPPFDAIIEAINGAQVNVLSIDIPSGLPSDPVPFSETRNPKSENAAFGPCVRATVTVTIGLPKLGMIVDPGVRTTGAVVVQDIGFPRDLLADAAIATNLMTPEEARELLPERTPGGNKGTFGRVMVLGGSEGMTGAAILAAQAAARSGVGLVYSCYPHPLGPVMESRLLEPVKLPLGGSVPWFIADHADRALRHAEQMQAVALGPGLGRNPETQAFVREIVRRVRAPLVIDADGLRLLAENLDDLQHRPGPTVLTPHPGEAADLLGCTVAEIEAGRLGAFTDLASTYEVVVVLKGAQTVTTTPDGQRTINPSGNTGLAKGGSGDVLTGLIAGLLAQGCAPGDAARLGVFVHGLAADIAAERDSVRGMIPSDVIDHLGRAFARLERGERR